MSVPEIPVEELKQRLDCGENLFLLDVRDERKFAISNTGVQLIPQPALRRPVNELDASRPIVTVCKMEPRGAKAQEQRHNAGFSNVWKLRCAFHAWSDRVDRRIRKD